jgi:cysteine desulfurase
MNAPDGRIYLDNHATTRVDPRVVKAMLPFFSEIYGNAASASHVFGVEARAAVDLARRRVAALINADPAEVVFTSGATESVNLALRGVAEAGAGRGNHVVTAATEHTAVLDTCRRLEEYGVRVTILPVDSEGLVDPDEVRKAITPKTLLVSVMAANNEIGTLADLGAVGAVCREKGVLLHTDAAQAAGKVPLDVRSLPVDLVSFTAHKMYGPKGVGALWLRGGVRISSQIQGGGHERGLRSGTLDVPGIVGFGAAAELALAEGPAESLRTAALRDHLVEGVTARLDGVRLNGHPLLRLPNNASLSFAGARAEAVIRAMRDVAVSTGSACSSAESRPSHVLSALGLDRETVLSTLRFGLGRFTTAEEIDAAVERVAAAVRTARAASPHLQHQHIES